MMFTDSPCKDCPDRYLKCHSTCKKWQNWKAEEALKNAELDKILKPERVFKEIQSEKSTRICRRIHNSHLRGYTVS